MVEDENAPFNEKQVKMLKKMADKRLAWESVTADLKVWIAFFTMAFAFVALFRETILTFLGVQ